MSQRELRALSSVGGVETRSRTRSRKALTHSMEEEVTRLNAELTEAQKVSAEKDKELRELRLELGRARTLAEEAQADAKERSLAAKGLEKELETERLRSELAVLRVVENLCTEHRRELEKEKELMSEECKRMEACVKDGFKWEKGRLLPEKDACVNVVGMVAGPTTHAPPETVTGTIAVKSQCAGEHRGGESMPSAASRESAEVGLDSGGRRDEVGTEGDGGLGDEVGTGDGSGDSGSRDEAVVEVGSGGGSRGDMARVESSGGAGVAVGLQDKSGEREDRTGDRESGCGGLTIPVVGTGGGMGVEGSGAVEGASQGEGSGQTGFL